MHLLPYLDSPILVPAADELWMLCAGSKEGASGSSSKMEHRNGGRPGVHLFIESNGTHGYLKFNVAGRLARAASKLAPDCWDDPAD